MKLKVSEFKLSVLFNVIIGLSAVLPVCISCGLLYVNYKRELLSQEENQKKIEEQILLSLNLVLSSLSVEVNSISQSSDIIELLNTKSELRRFVENRVFGRLEEMRARFKVPFEWGLFEENSRDPFLYSAQFEVINILSYAEGFSLDDLKKNIIVKKAIKLDDQYLSGPNSKEKGILVLKIGIESIGKVIPGLLSIEQVDKNLNFQSLKVQIIKPIYSNFQTLVSIILLAVILIFSFFVGISLLRNLILLPINKMSLRLNSELKNVENINRNKNELVVLESVLDSYVENLKNEEVAKTNRAKSEAIANITKQVAHDIRSPLSALNLVSSTLNEVAEEKRLLIRNAVQRINDIANQLLEMGKEVIHSTENSHPNDLIRNSNIKENEVKLKVEFLAPLVDSIVSEKRIQFREKKDVLIESDINQAYGLFAFVNSIELKRTISNLINNSVEAFAHSKGQLIVAIRGYKETISIIIQDNGKGIPESLIARLGEKGLSYGKTGTESGSGLGIYHAKKTIEDFGGKFEIISKVNLGTTITLHLNRIDAPKWFVREILIVPNLSIISLDDDMAIHQIWRGRLQSLNIKSDLLVNHLSFTSGEEFRSWVLNQNLTSTNINKNRLFLVDYELLGQNKTGLDLIEELKIEKESILVTSRFEESQIKLRCERAGVAIIPKTMAGFVPFKVEI